MKPPKMMSRRGVLQLGPAGSLGGLLLSEALRRKPKRVTSFLWRVWETSCDKVFFDPFTAQSGIEIKTVPGVLFAKPKADGQTGNYEDDQFNLGDSEYARGRYGYDLKRVEKEVADNRAMAVSSVCEYGIVTLARSTLAVYRKEKFRRNGGPQSWGSFRNVEEFRLALSVRPLVHVPRNLHCWRTVC